MEFVKQVLTGNFIVTTPKADNKKNLNNLILYLKELGRRKTDKTQSRK